MSPDNIVDELELALMGQPALLAYLAAIDAWFNEDDPEEIRSGEDYDAMYEAKGLAQRYCNHEGTRIVARYLGVAPFPKECHTCWRVV